MNNSKMIFPGFIVPLVITTVLLLVPQLIELDPQLAANFVWARAGIWTLYVTVAIVDYRRHLK